MGAKTVSTTSGGGAATPVANEFQAWLMSQLTGQGNPGGAYMGGQQGQPAPVNANGMQPRTGTAQPGGAFNPNISLGQQGSPLPTSFNQNGSSFTNAFNNMLNGQLADPSGANAAIASGIGSGASQFGQNYQNPYTSQDYNAAQLSQLPTNFGAGQTGMADLSGVGPTAQSQFKPQDANSQFTGVLQQLLGQGGQMAMNGSHTGSASAGQASIGQGIALDPATQFDMNNPYFNALKTQQQRALAEATAANNARFGAAGAGAIGSGAQLANSNLQSAASADQTVALQQALQGLQQQDLAERGTRANVGLTSRGQDAQVGIANAGNTTQANIASLQAMLQGQGQNNSLLSSLLGAAGNARGQDFQNQQFTSGQGLEQSLANAGFQNTRQGQDLQALLANQGLGNQFGLGAAGLNNDAMQTNNGNALSQANSQNQFNLTNQNQLAGFQNQTNGLNSQNHQANQQNFLSLLGLGQNTNQMANQNQAAALQQLFQSFGQSNGLGIEGRNTQTNTQGSPWGSILGTILPIAGQAIGSAWSNRGSGGGGGSATNGGGPVMNGSFNPFGSTTNWGG